MRRLNPVKRTLDEFENDPWSAASSQHSSSNHTYDIDSELDGDWSDHTINDVSVSSVIGINATIDNASTILARSWRGGQNDHIYIQHPKTVYGCITIVSTPTSFNELNFENKHGSSHYPLWDQSYLPRFGEVEARVTLKFLTDGLVPQVVTKHTGNYRNRDLFYFHVRHKNGNTESYRVGVPQPTWSAWKDEYFDQWITLSFAIDGDHLGLY